MYKFSKIIFAYYLLFLFWGILFKFDITHTINTAPLFPSRSLNVSPFDASGGLMGLLLYHAFQKNERRQDVVSLFFGGFLLFFTFILLLH